MMRHKGLVAGAVMAVVAAGQAWAGITYQARTTAEGTKGADMQSNLVRAWVDGNSAKVEFVESNNPMMGKGTYLVTSDGSKTLFLVNPKEKTYSKFDLDGITQIAGGAMKMMHAKFSDPKVEPLGEESGGLVVGIPTTLYRYRVSYTMSMSFMGMKTSNQTVEEYETWVAPKLVEAALGIWLRRDAPKTGNADLDALVRAQRSRWQGFPLKQRTVQTVTDNKGKTQVTTTTMEVIDWQPAVIPASTFGIPAGFKETDMFSAMGGEGNEGENPFAKMLGGGKEKE